jgi:proteasome lid subunit RPN8/RPN11
MFDEQVDLGRKPEEFARLWIHSHPSDCPEPSDTDEETFERVFGNCQWVVMFILAENNQVYTRLSFNVGPCSQVEIPVMIDYCREFGPSDIKKWDAEYKANVTIDNWLETSVGKNKKASNDIDLESYALPYDFIEELENMNPTERQIILDELAARPDLWNEESEVMYL